MALRFVGIDPGTNGDFEAVWERAIPHADYRPSAFPEFPARRGAPVRATE